MKFAFALLAVALLPALLNAEYTKFQWTGTNLKDIKILDIDVTPMPIIQPGKGQITFVAELLREVKGKLKVDLNIIRKVSGVSLPVRCYLAAGVYVGSCVYEDLCSMVQTLLPESFNPTACPPEMAQYGIDCTCPFNIKKTTLDIADIEVEFPDAAATIATFLASGDFDITLKPSDPQGAFGTITVHFTVKPKK